MPERFIGGMFELELPARRDGLIALWGVSDDPHLSFALARSALRALVNELAPRAVWLPAYICKSVPRQISPDRLRYYPVGEHLAPDVDLLADATRPGDAVVAMNYFGMAPDAEFIRFAAERNDLVFIEDCAQTIDTGLAPWGDFRIFSPRKLLGVPDGGIVVPVRRSAPAGLKTAPVVDLDAVAPLLVRYEDQTGELWNTWHEGHERWTRQLESSDRRMSRLTRSLLGTVDVPALAAARRANFETLRDLLQSISYLDQCTGELAPPAFVPFGFPIRLGPNRRDRVRGALWKRGVYAFRHFADLTCPVTGFEAEHALSRELITLPCDQRYSVADMELIASVVQSALRTPVPA